ncbi:unnamed protein product [Dibothriocephalus latus]|uniref:Uncharacterized protein n=1 Tax=Dibothriocephalus latus TaxID=60516 RepID=A0A3P7M1D2_DIBLA|nr:unnamed protein product [Dibothriocephalus latus]
MRGAGLQTHLVENKWSDMQATYETLNHGFSGVIIGILEDLRKEIVQRVALLDFVRLLGQLVPVTGVFV